MLDIFLLTVVVELEIATTRTVWVLT